MQPAKTHKCPQSQLLMKIISQCYYIITENIHPQGRIFFSLTFYEPFMSHFLFTHLFIHHTRINSCFCIVILANTFYRFHKISSCYHYLVSATHAFQKKICADALNFPFCRTTRVRFLQANNISHNKNFIFSYFSKIKAQFFH